MRQRVLESVLNFPGQNPYLILKIHRTSVIQDTLTCLQMQNPMDLRKPLRVKFIGEEGVDEGGVKKEFFQILVRELFDANYGMFSYNKETNVFWINAHTFTDAQEFELVGMILGLAIYNNIILDVRFPNLIFKKLLKKELTFDDFRDFDPVFAKSFSQLLEFEGDVKETFLRSFVHEYKFFGESKVEELKKDGAKIPVTKENRKEYVELYSKYLMEGSVKKQFDMLNQGFEMVAGADTISLFRWEELQLLVCGSELIDFEELERSSRYADGFEKTDATIKYFWEIAHALDDENKRKLLSFCTGSDRIPIRGLADLILTISKNGNNDTHLPTSHTCYNHLLLPEYSTKQIMKERLMTAIQNSEGFGLI
eukprot:UN04987